ncbi:LOW QUALITY PROTEIN: hypothetical protein Cgig2_026682 [Carnegiea gigantea]|uniref:Uncharacterized protein n=1 Tax=Carnegiea gigantea TaxID=171969 RepID=A0A9Q1JYG1_9CARY|nr:LOW QUALITY PROTEIN: hypothetical protein Cgig2_026682 [Carnegiea gigantea]
MKLQRISVCHGEEGQSLREGSRSGNSYISEEVAGDIDDNVSLAEEDDVDLHNVLDEGRGRYRRHTAGGDEVVSGDGPRVGVLVGADPILDGRVTLDIVVDLVSRLRPLHVEAIKGTISKHILQYCAFGLRRKLTLTIVKRWVPCRRAFSDRDKEFDGEEVSGDLGRMGSERLAEIVVAKIGKWKCQKE